MIDYLKSNHLSLLIVAYLLFGAFLPGHAPQAAAPSYGATTANTTTVSNPWVYTSTLKIGASGTAKSNDIVSTCSIISDASAATNTPAYGWCSLAGVVSTDLISAGFATSSTNLNDGWSICGAIASTTAGKIDFKLCNMTGKAQALSAASVIGSSTVIRAAH